MMELETTEDFDGSLIRLCLSLSVFFVALTSDRSTAKCGQDRTSPYNHLSIGQEYVKLFAYTSGLNQSVYRQKIWSRCQTLLQMQQVDCDIALLLWTWLPGMSIYTNRSWAVHPKIRRPCNHCRDRISTSTERRSLHWRRNGSNKAIPIGSRILPYRSRGSGGLALPIASIGMYGCCLRHCQRLRWCEWSFSFVFG